MSTITAGMASAGMASADSIAANLFTADLTGAEPGAKPPVVSTRLRLTRRGRAVLSLFVAAPIVAVILGLALAGGEATATSGPVDVPVVTVEAGQTLWHVAGALAPEANPADVVADILAINELSSASVLPGQTLIIPARYVD